MKNKAKHGLVACFLGLGMAWSGPTPAQSLPDPMRPADYVEPKAAAALSEEAAPPPEPQRWVLTGTYLARSGQRWAIINGLKVYRGEPVGNAMLAEVGAGWAILRRGEEAIDLKLIPGGATGKKPAFP
jgi:hypothetical protein